MTRGRRYLERHPLLSKRLCVTCALQVVVVVYIHECERIKKVMLININRSELRVCMSGGH